MDVLPRDWGGAEERKSSNIPSPFLSALVNIFPVAVGFNSLLHSHCSFQLPVDNFCLVPHDPELHAGFLLCWSWVVYGVGHAPFSFLPLLIPFILISNVKFSFPTIWCGLCFFDCLTNIHRLRINITKYFIDQNGGLKTCRPLMSFTKPWMGVRLPGFWPWIRH